MVRISGINLIDNKRIAVALTSIYGIGRPIAAKILQETKLTANPKVKELNETEVERLRTYIEKSLTTESDARSIVNQNIKRLKDISSYRGVRHTAKLPVRGQRTKTNARTKRGKRVTMGSGRTDTSQKT